MDMNTYQKRAHAATGHGLKKNRAAIYCILGATRGLGELANEAKHLVRKDKRATSTRTIAHLAHEAGNILWYVSELCSIAGIDLNTVAKRSLENV